MLGWLTGRRSDKQVPFVHAESSSAAVISPSLPAEVKTASFSCAFKEDKIIIIRHIFNGSNSANSSLKQKNVVILLDPIIDKLKSIPEKVGDPFNTVKDLLETISQRKKYLEVPTDYSALLSTSTKAELRRGLNAVEEYVKKCLCELGLQYGYNSAITKAQRDVRKAQQTQVLNCCMIMCLCGCAIPANILSTALNICTDAESDCTLTFCPAPDSSWGTAPFNIYNMFAAPCHGALNLCIHSAILESEIDKLSPQAERMLL